jgi:hypothetical protein
VFEAECFFAERLQPGNRYRRCVEDNNKVFLSVLKCRRTGWPETYKIHGWSLNRSKWSMAREFAAVWGWTVHTDIREIYFAILIIKHYCYVCVCTTASNIAILKRIRRTMCSLLFWPKIHCSPVIIKHHEWRLCVAMPYERMDMVDKMLHFDLKKIYKRRKMKTAEQWNWVENRGTLTPHHGRSYKGRAAQKTKNNGKFTLPKPHSPSLTSLSSIIIGLQLCKPDQWTMRKAPRLYFLQFKFVNNGKSQPYSY